MIHFIAYPILIAIAFYFYGKNYMTQRFETGKVLSFQYKQKMIYAELISLTKKNEEHLLTLRLDLMEFVRIFQLYVEQQNNPDKNINVELYPDLKDLEKNGFSFAEISAESLSAQKIFYSIQHLDNINKVLKKYMQEETDTFPDFSNILNISPKQKL